MLVGDNRLMWSSRLSWRPLEVADFPLLAGWLREPHVARWWCHDTSPEGVDADFGAVARGAAPGEDLLLLLDDEPIGLVQRCRWGDYSEYLDEIAPILPVDGEDITLDYLIGDPNLIGRGVGTAAIGLVLADSWRRYPAAAAAVIPIAAGNRSSWRALERNGFVRVAEGDLPPDNPIDPPLHYVYRIARPGQPASD